MAILVPSLRVIGKLKVRPTDGELYLCEFLKEKLDDTCYVFFKPYLDGDRPDIIVLKKECGAVIVEIKDWDLNCYTIDQKNCWSVGGSAVKSPFSQVFKYKTNLFDLHLPTLGLKEALNQSFFKVINCYVYFHLQTKVNIKEKYNLVLDKIRIELRELNEKFKIKFFKENNEIRKKEIHKIYDKNRIKLQTNKRNLDRDESLSIAKDDADHLLKKINELQPNELFTKNIFDEFYNVLNPPDQGPFQVVKLIKDKKQTGLMNSVQEFKKISGPAGSGKTTILAKLALNAFKRHSSPVLILTFNITLKQYIKDKISSMGENIGINNFEITNYHQFFESQLNNYNIDTSQLRQSDLDLRYKTDFFKEQKINKYQTILVDEVQDYEPEWVKIIRANFLDLDKKKDGEMILFADPSQNIYERDLKTRESVFVRGFGDWVKLKKSYRSDSSQLIKLFKEFQQVFLTKIYPDLDTFDFKPRQTDFWELIKYQTYSAKDDLKEIYLKIIDYIAINKFAPKDITIVCSNIELLRNLNSLFNLKQRTMVMFEDLNEYYEIIGCNDKTPINERKEKAASCEQKIKKIRQRKKNFFKLNSELMKISTIHSFKGLESPTVFCILLENDSPEIIYTAITRAKQNLIIFDVINSHYSSFFKKLLS